MDARRFSTRQGCLVEKSRRRSGPGARSASGAQAGRAFSWLLLFARAKRSNSLLRSRSDSPAFKLSLGLLLLSRAKPQATARAGSRTFAPPSGRALLLFARAKRSNQEKHGPGRDPPGCARRFPALLACQGDGAQLASLRHVRLFAPCPAAVLGPLYGLKKSKENCNCNCNRNRNRNRNRRSIAPFTAPAHAGEKAERRGSATHRTTAEDHP